MNKMMLLLTLLFTLFSCGEEKFDDNIFLIEEDSLSITTNDTVLSLQFSRDSVEVNSPIVFSIIAKGISVDSTKFSFYGSEIDKDFSNFVPTFTYSYTEKGTFFPLIILYSNDTSYSLSAKLTVVEDGFFLKLDSIKISKSDTISVEYKDDTTLTKGSKPLIAFLGGIDTVFYTIGDSLIDPGAVAFDEEDGEIKKVVMTLDSVLANVSDTTVPGYGALIYTVEDKDKNIVTRSRICKISNPLYKIKYTLNENDTIYDSYSKFKFTVKDNIAISDSISAIGKGDLYLKFLAVGNEEKEDIENGYTLLQIVGKGKNVVSVTYDSKLIVTVNYNTFLTETFDIDSVDITKNNWITVGIAENGLSVIVNDKTYHKDFEEKYNYVNGYLEPSIISLGSDLSKKYVYSGKLAIFEMLVSSVATQYIKEIK